MEKLVSVNTFTITRRIVLLMLFISSGGPIAYAQIRGVEEGDRVRISAPSVESRKIKGTVSAITPSMISVSSGDTTIFIVNSAIEQLQISTGKKRNTGKGAIIGAISGAAILGIISFTTNKPCGEREWCFFEMSNGEALGFGALAGALGGGLNGAIIGTFIKTDRWEEAPLGISMRPVSSSNSYLTFEPVISVRFSF